MDSTAGIPIRSEHQPTIGAAARFQTEYHGRQPGDPARAARVLLKVAAMENPPLRLPLGSDAVKAIEQNEIAKIEADQKWRSLSVSTDFFLKKEEEVS